jgi:multiple sugar transport system substrate-binding protein
MPFYYNKNLFDNANIPYPVDVLTWEQFRDLSIRLHSETSYGSILPYDIWTLDLLMTSTGNGLLSPDGETAIGYLDSPETVRVMQWLNSYYREDPKKTEPQNYTNQFEAFRAGRAAMVIDTINHRLTEITGGDEDTLGVMPLPYFEGSKRGNPTYVAGLGISAKSKHPDEAWEFIQFLELRNKNSQGGLSTIKSISEARGQSSDPFLRVFTEEMEYAAIASLDSNPHVAKAWLNNQKLQNQFYQLLTTDEGELAEKMRSYELIVELESKME